MAEGDTPSLPSLPPRDLFPDPPQAALPGQVPRQDISVDPSPRWSYDVLSEPVKRHGPAGSEQTPAQQAPAMWSIEKVSVTKSHPILEGKVPAREGGREAWPSMV